MRISFVVIGHIQIRCACREDSTKVGTCLMLALPTDLTNRHLQCRAQSFVAAGYQLSGVTTQADSCKDLSIKKLV